MGKVKLSVIMPTYNSSNYLDKTMDSLLNALDQQNCELLCIDDGSRDDTFDKLTNYAKSNNMVKVFSHQHVGVSQIRNIGLSRAIGEYVVFVDSDDLIEENFYRTLLGQLVDYKPDVILEDVQGIKKDVLIKSLTEHQRLEAIKINLRFGEVTMSWGIGSRIYKNSFLQKNNLKFDDKLVVSEDMLFVMQALCKADSLLVSPRRFYYLQESHTLFRFNSKNLASELHFRESVQKLMRNFQDSLARDINNRTKITGFIFLVDSYFGPLFNKGKISFHESVSLMKIISKKYFYDTAFSENKFDKYLSRKAPMYRRLFRRHVFGLVLVINALIDKVVKIDRFR